jgi:serine protease Do
MLATIKRGLAAFIVVPVAMFAAGNAAAVELPDFTELVEENAGAVVNISTVAERPPAPSARRGGPRDDQLEDFFRFFRPPNARPRSSLGSGFIISKDGYILTNNHVVDRSSEIVVRLSDRRELVAELVGVDPTSDLAVLKVETDEELPVVKLGSSEALKVGEWVLAIGSPFGFDYSVTAGIVSAKGRSLPNAQRENYVPYIQTDVAINPGNSGGPLFNLDGEVVGINSQIYSNSGTYMGVSFSIPIDVAVEVAEQLRDTGRVSRGWLGVMIQPVTRDLAESFGLDRPFGALISQVMEGGPAQTGGLQEGDIITHFNGRSVERSAELPHYVGRLPAGESATLTIVRGGKTEELALKVGELPENPMSLQPASTVPSANSLGLVVQNLTSDEKTRMGMTAGVRVIEVEESAAQAGIRRGDVITRLNNRAVDDVADLDDIIADLAAGRTFPVLVVRNGTPVFLPIRVPE